MDVSRQIIVAYGERAVEVGLGVEFGFISGKAKGMGVMTRKRRVGGSGSGVFWVSSTFFSKTGSHTSPKPV